MQKPKEGNISLNHNVQSLGDNRNKNDNTHKKRRLSWRLPPRTSNAPRGDDDAARYVGGDASGARAEHKEGQPLDLLDEDQTDDSKRDAAEDRDHEGHHHAGGHHGDLFMCH